MEQLLLVALGPAQALFESAPSTQDAWCGLWLLDRVAGEVARALERHGAVTTLAGEHRHAPRLEQGRRIAVALRPPAAPGAVAAEARDAVRGFLASLGIELTRWLQVALAEGLGRWFSSEAMVAQLHEVFEVTWVAVPGAGPAALARADDALVDRLDSRLWDTWQREDAPRARGDLVVPPLDRALYVDPPTPESAAAWSHLVAVCGLSSATPRCGVGLLQRMIAAGRPVADPTASDAPQTCSTAHVALPRPPEAAGAQRTQEVLAQFAGHFAGTVGVRRDALRRFRLPDGGFDAQLLDPRRFVEHAREVGGRVPDAATLATLTRHRRTALAALGVAPEAAADVLILFRWQAADHAPRLEGAAAHRFVGEARRKVEQAGGGTLHFAPDAWVALLPVGTAFGCVAAIRTAWRAAHLGAGPPAPEGPPTGALPGFSAVAQVVGSALPLAQAMALAANLATAVGPDEPDLLAVGLAGPTDAPVRWTVRWSDDPQALLEEAVRLTARAVLSPEVARALNDWLAHCGTRHPFGGEAEFDVRLASAACRRPRDPELRAWLRPPAAPDAAEGRAFVTALKGRVALMHLAATVGDAHPEAPQRRPEA